MAFILLYMKWPKEYMSLEKDPDTYDHLMCDKVTVEYDRAKIIFLIKCAGVFG